MIFPEKLQLIRKSKGFTQEELAERLGVSRQAVAKWESAQGYPDIENLINLSTLFNVTVDYLVKDTRCQSDITDSGYEDKEINKIIDFRLEANINTYAAYADEINPSRPGSHDYRYDKDEYTYIDTYVGGEIFAGEEAVFKSQKTVYAMNYCGRITGETFSGDFLKQALRQADKAMPYRGPEHYEDGEYVYTSKVTGDVSWFQGYEEISCAGVKVYECYFHGGLMK
ncbi:MAG: helix-turn-helix transcriptional regulator [Clostridiales bacterium]|nr:helix-turn-helix transcriptional regulator [Clostridiales bacterium]